MPLYCCEGIVLRSRRVEESDRLVHFFTDCFGKVRATIKGVTRSGSRYGSIAEPLTHSQLSLYRPREERPIFSVTNFSPIRSNQEIRQDLGRFYAASFVAELLDQCTEDGDPQHDLWLLFLETLHHLGHSPNLNTLLLAFQLKAFHYLGLGMVLGKCFNCAESPPAQPRTFSGRLGGILCGGCRMKDPSAVSVSDDLYRMLVLALAEPLIWATQNPCSEELWKESLAVFRPFWQHHLDFDSKSVRFIETF